MGKIKNAPNPQPVISQDISLTFVIYHLRALDQAGLELTTDCCHANSAKSKTTFMDTFFALELGPWSTPEPTKKSDSE